MAGIAVLAKRVLKHFREPVRVNDESAHSELDQMIEREGDERFLKNWDERFGQIVRQWL